MNETALPIEERIALLERSFRRARFSAAVLAVALVAALVGTELARRPPKVLDEVRTRRLVVTDDQGQMRVEIVQDRTAGRRSRAAGLTIYDHKGTERGGFGTMDDGSAVFALDAPEGVGSPMRDRLGMVVWPNGSADIALNDNQGRTAAALHCDANVSGVQVFKSDPDANKTFVRTLTYDGDQQKSVPLDK